MVLIAQLSLLCYSSPRTFHARSQPWQTFYLPSVRRERPRRSPGVSQFVPKELSPELGFPSQAHPIPPSIDGAIQAFDSWQPPVLQDHPDSSQDLEHSLLQVGAGRGR